MKVQTFADFQAAIRATELPATSTLAVLQVEATAGRVSELLYETLIGCTSPNTKRMEYAIGGVLAAIAGLAELSHVKLVDAANGSLQAAQGPSSSRLSQQPKQLKQAKGNKDV